MEDGDGPDSPAGSDTNAVGLHDVSQTLISNRFLMIVCVYFSSYFFFLSYRFRLIVHLTDDPRARLSSYATTGNQLATSDESLDKLIELIIATTDKLISAFHQVRN